MLLCRHAYLIGFTTLLHDFCASGPPCGDGAFPEGNVILDASGNIYGTAAGGGAQDCWNISGEYLHREGTEARAIQFTSNSPGGRWRYI